MININLDRDTTVEVDQIPNQCPYCHKSIEPKIIGHNSASSNLEMIYRCTGIGCRRAFIGRYEYRGYIPGQVLIEISAGSYKPIEFSDTIKSVSENFIKIFNEASYAEQHGLKEICGVGYRKSLEFLIKDYLIQLQPEKADQIKRKFLGNCISDYVSDSRIKSAAKRAVWLGNDETHYVKLWEDKNLEDLKKLIQLTMHWIEMERLSSSFESNMPEKKV